MFGRRKRKRDIFNYWDGTKKRSIDPLVAFQQMDDHKECDFRRDAEDGNIFDPQGNIQKPDYDARQRLVDMMCEVFGVKQYGNGTGLTVDEIFTLFYTFTGYMYQRKKKVERSLTTSPPSAGKRSQTSSDDSQPTGTQSESASTPDESNSEEVLSS